MTPGVPPDTPPSDGSATPVAPSDPGPAPRPTVPRGPFVLVAVVVLVLGAAVAVRSLTSTDGPADASALNGTELGAPQPRPEFTLRDTEGEPFAFAERTEGRLTLLFFGYTSCPDICPLHLANLADALDRPGVPRPVVVFVGVDHERDTPEAVRAFLDRFDPAFVGLVGTPDELRAAQEAALVAPAILEEPDEPGGDYLVGHASQIIAYTADDRATVVYPFGVRQQDWVQDLPVLARVPGEGA